MRISILGSGKIGLAILNALIDSKLPDYIIATGRSEETLNKIRQLGVEATKDNNLAVKNSEYVIISVKPQQFIDLVKSVETHNWKGKTIISVMAGVKISTIRNLTKGERVFRAMPNINAVVKKSTTALAEKRDEEVDKIFRTIGSTFWVQEELLDAWTALIGSGPAFIAELVDAFVLGAVNCGMGKELAYKAVLDMIKGTIETLLNYNSHPLELRDKVTTPAGTTIRGLMVMESKGVKSAIIRTIEAAYKRSIRLGKDLQKTLNDPQPK